MPNEVRQKTIQVFEQEVGEMATVEGMFEGFIPKEIQDALIDYFNEFGYECHLRSWQISKVPGMEEFDIEIKVHANRRTSETPVLE